MATTLPYNITTLAYQLRELEGEMSPPRETFAGGLPRVEHYITPLGISLLPVIDAMCIRGRLHINTME